MQQQQDCSITDAAASQASSYPKILQWSVCKIADSRRRRTGIDLRRNLLIANVIFKARTGILQQRARQLTEARLETVNATSVSNQHPVSATDNSSSSLGKRASSSIEFQQQQQEQQSAIAVSAPSLPKQAKVHSDETESSQQQQQQLLGSLQASFLESQALPYLTCSS
ncbi:hypothetical protein BOX15_Mlig003195g1 [Macrostomum lignano]|uniref:Uncharacterized protein n=1 Tax=Macrostomum lignano TaxID=282301 RepID=A0A267GRY9_9PLAT|nr:hypothetical protein BOX15_Mlig003195g3 [Macrostomum lignano]PAA88069.1 hypothetical protein BOX15_Mlig003195g1 [Macrostomum lignano]